MGLPDSILIGCFAGFIRGGHVLILPQILKGLRLVQLRRVSHDLSWSPTRASLALGLVADALLRSKMRVCCLLQSFRDCLRLHAVIIANMQINCKREK